MKFKLLFPLVLVFTMFFGFSSQVSAINVTPFADSQLLGEPASHIYASKKKGTKKKGTKKKGTKKKGTKGTGCRYGGKGTKKGSKKGSKKGTKGKGTSCNPSLA
ncbi:MAG: hypothetical protein ACJA0C_000212 [Candidatus Endobugula sp.]|jgi:hypothetical protein